MKEFLDFIIGKSNKLRLNIDEEISSYLNYKDLDVDKFMTSFLNSVSAMITKKYSINLVTFKEIHGTTRQKRSKYFASIIQEYINVSVTNN